MEVIISVTAIALVTGTVMMRAFHQLESHLETETRTEALALAEGVLRYARDFEELPDSLGLLIGPPEGDSDWTGPYLEWALGTTASDALLDGWRRPYGYAELTGTRARIRSAGANGVHENGDGDDVQVDVSIAPILRRRAVAELRILNTAVDIYNAAHLPDEPLPEDYADLLAVLQESGLIPSDEDSTKRYLGDGWGQMYETYGTPVLEVRMSGAP